MEKPPVSTFPRAVSFLVFFLLLALPLYSSAQEFTLVSDTLLRMWEPDVDGDDGISAPLYEYLQLDVGDPAEKPLTFHLYGWGRVDMGDGGYYDKVYGGDTGGELLYGYLQYVHPETGVDVRLGRQYIFEGVARNESVDGLRVESALGESFSGSIYAGQPSDLDSEHGREGDYIYGARLAHHQRGLWDLGLSFKSVDNDDDRVEEQVGADLSLFLPGGVNLYGTSVYDLQDDGWTEHFYSADFKAGPLRLRPFFEHYRFDDYFDADDRTPGTFRFLAGLDERLTIFGGDVLWEREGGIELGARFKHYDYDERDEKSQFFSLLGVWNGEDLSQVGGELGRMNGDTDETRYYLARAYFYRDQVKTPYVSFVTGDVVYVFYDDEVAGEDDSLTLSLGAGNRFLNDRLELRVAGEYNHTPYFDHDLRGWVMARLAYGR